MLGTGPLVLALVRYAGSPACDAALRSYRAHLQPELPRLGAHLVAVSPQASQRLAAVKHREELGYLVASDPRHVLIDALNIGFGHPGADVVLGTGRSVLPFASVVVVDRAGVVRFAEVRAGWSGPIPPGRVIDTVRCLTNPSTY